MPAFSTIERLCADALVDAERRIETRIAEKLDAGARERLDGLLTKMLAGSISRFIWLRKFEVGTNSAAANRLLDRLEFLRRLNLDPQVLAGSQTDAEVGAKLLAAGISRQVYVQKIEEMTRNFICRTEETGAFVRLGGEMQYTYTTLDNFPVASPLIVTCP